MVSTVVELIYYRHQKFDRGRQPFHIPPRTRCRGENIFLTTCLWEADIGNEVWEKKSFRRLSRDIMSQHDSVPYGVLKNVGK
jgi:hypothetical protein